jgi:hypothetical protein
MGLTDDIPTCDELISRSVDEAEELIDALSKRTRTASGAYVEKDNVNV